MRKEFITADYESAHSKKPRGGGHWGFVPAGRIWPQRMNLPAGTPFYVWGSYSVAKKAAAALCPEVQSWKVVP